MPPMASEEKDLLGRLADAGEDALRRLSEAPGMDRATAFAKSTRKQLDDVVLGRSASASRPRDNVSPTSS